MIDPGDPTFKKLINVLGPEKAEGLAKETLASIGRTALATPEDRLAFGDALLKRGGLYAAIGTAIRVQAFLMGAVDRAR